jgi:serine/threonine-protein kinase
MSSIEETGTLALDGAASTEARAQLAPGQAFRGLHVHSVLGAGAMGDAYLVSHPILRIPVVVKTFRQAPPDDLFAEARLAARVASPHVVPVLDAGIDRGLAFITQGYVDGIDLAELLRALGLLGRRLPFDAVARILRDVGSGLHAIHQAGVIHRDVKPANLFLRGDGTALVGDFGVALATGRDDPDRPAAGTPGFMAPEQWTRGRIDRRTDVYALGATAHLMATGDLPFNGRDLAEVGRRHREEAYVAPPPSSPEEAYLFAVIERALAKDPERRYPTAAAMVRALGSVTIAPAPVLHDGPDHARMDAVAVRLTVGDLAQAQADVIVNAANVWLTMRLGVAAALRLTAGDEVEAEATASAPVPMGAVVWTGPGRLAARAVAHAVAANDGAVCLQRCTLRVLLGAEARGARSVAFPALGTGVGEVPMEQAARLILEAVRTFAALEPRAVREVTIVLYDEEARARWREILRWM